MKIRKEELKIWKAPKGGRNCQGNSLKGFKRILLAIV